MEENIINWSGDTHFYINFDDKKYGLRISVEDSYRKKELINRMHTDKNTQLQINAWKKEWQEMEEQKCKI